ncbi:hypothetical protein VIGAN_04108400 [Vigna angularis var. angularis]|uniref:Uncharacterized protein n=1 Tax=Vigna angularis var. angularis TaxID=157739 RepID=A0A0S3RTF7_PHAAN|nr:hypothetical protein VIGAN_04108400 [Vigna angularis var. angularis]
MKLKLENVVLGLKKEGDSDFSLVLAGYLVELVEPGGVGVVIACKVMKVGFPDIINLGSMVGSPNGLDDQPLGASLSLKGPIMGVGGSKPFVKHHAHILRIRFCRFSVDEARFGQPLVVGLVPALQELLSGVEH